MAGSVTYIPATKTRFASKPIDASKKKRVAAYARVSTDKDEQFTSYEAQINYYTRFIKEHKDWVFVDMYADEGITGTHTKCREGFLKMISDAMNGKIDLIITKSVSRFARNTVDSIQTIRDLKAKGVEVYFEKENIYTFDGKGEVMLTIMSSIAQEESRSISENILWSVKKRYEEGKFSVAYSNFLGYDKGPDNKLIINKIQAQTVKYIFESFLSGQTPGAIASDLKNKKMKTGTGGYGWTSDSVIRILKNEKYCGNAILQKTFKTDLLSERKENTGEVPKYFVEHSHEAIVSEEVFNAAQEELNNRFKSSSTKHTPSKSIFANKIICGDCGTPFGSKVWHSTDKYRRVIWQCRSKFKNEIHCSTPHLSEKEIQSIFLQALNKLTINKESIIEDLTYMQKKLLDTTELEKQLVHNETELEISRTMAEKLINEGFFPADSEKSKLFDEYQKKNEQAEKSIEDLRRKIHDRQNRFAAITRFIDSISSTKDYYDSFDSDLWIQLADHITVYSKQKLTVTFKSGQEVEVQSL